MELFSKEEKLIAFALLLFLVGLFFKLWQNEVRDFAAFKGEVSILGEMAEKHAKEVEETHRNALKETNDAWKRQLPDIRKNAINNYVRRFPGGLSVCPSSGNVPGAADNPQVPGGSTEERMATRTTQELEVLGDFIEDCAIDAGRLVQLREWTNKVGIKPSTD